MAISLFALPASVRAQGGAPLRLRVDARQAPDRIVHAELTVPADAGRMTLAYPKWIPGEHGPTGPIVDLLGLRFEAGGRTLPWERDPMDAYLFHLDVPAGTTAVTAHYDFVSPLDPEAFSQAESFTERLGVLTWHSVLLYPAARSPAEVTVAAELTLPAGWSHASALATSRTMGATIVFEPASVATLVDSPVLFGKYLRTISLGTHGGAPHWLALAGDSEAALDAPPHVIDGLRRLCAESLALFGARHYRSYTFLAALSDRFHGAGLEHHESSDNRLPEFALREEGEWLANVELLPHEIAHSWNGKYRWPADLIPGDLQSPRSFEPLWIYEGLTEYLGWVLSARSRMQSEADARHRLARTASYLQTNTGRRWRSLRDTSVGGYYQFFASPHWQSWRRATDFYDEGFLLWLEVDVRIRRLTGGRRSLDDYCRAFFGGQNGPPEVLSYTLDDVSGALSRVAPHDWRSYFTERTASTDSLPPLGGITGAGWRMSWADSVHGYWETIETSYGQMDLRPTLGLRLDAENGGVRDVVPGSPAARAGVVPGMKIVAVDGRAFTPQVMRRALRDEGPLDLIVENLEFYRVLRIPDAPRERVPVLAREAGQRDLLAEIMRARVRR
jgi:predicted metalloprotease with PDZ domain